MVSHLAARRCGVGIDVGVAIELREEGADVRHLRSPHEGLVAVVARPPVAWAEGLGHSQLRNLLAVAEDPEGGVPAQDLRAPDDAGPAAAVGEAVVGDDGFGSKRRLGVAKRFGHIGR